MVPKTTGPVLKGVLPGWNVLMGEEASDVNQAGRRDLGKKTERTKDVESYTGVQWSDMVSSFFEDGEGRVCSIEWWQW